MEVAEWSTGRHGHHAPRGGYPTNPAELAGNNLRKHKQREQG